MCQFALKPFSIDTSPLMIELRTLKASRPEMTPDDEAKFANELLEKDGMSYTFYFDPATCEKISKAYAATKPGDRPPTIKATLKSVGGETAALLFPPPDPKSCTPCSVSLPALQVTAVDFITKISERNIKFYLPNGFTTEQVQLLDTNDMDKVKQTWRVPFNAVPLGVLYDENAIYLAMPNPELIDLSLLVFDDGTFQFATRKEAEANGKSSRSTPGKIVDQTHNYLTFQNRDKKQVVRYSKACG